MSYEIINQDGRRGVRRLSDGAEFFVGDKVTGTRSCLEPRQGYVTILKVSKERYCDTALDIETGFIKCHKTKQPTSTFQKMEKLNTFKNKIEENYNV